MATTDPVPVDWSAEFERAGAIWRHAGADRPHAAHQLSDHHSGYYFNTDVLTSQPAVLDDVVRRGCLPLIEGARPDWVVAPLSSIASGLLLADAVARALGVRVGYVDLRSGEVPSPLVAGRTALVVNDDVHGGSSVVDACARLRDHGVELIGPVVTLANFSGRSSLAGLPVKALSTTSFEKWTPARCPLCRAGSVALPARSAWAQLISGE